MEAPSGKPFFIFSAFNEIIARHWVPHLNRALTILVSQGVWKGLFHSTKWNLPSNYYTLLLSWKSISLRHGTTMFCELTSILPLLLHRLPTSFCFLWSTCCRLFIKQLFWHLLCTTSMRSKRVCVHKEGFGLSLDFSWMNDRRQLLLHKTTAT